MWGDLNSSHPVAFGFSRAELLGGTENKKQYTHTEAKGDVITRPIKVFVCFYAAMQVSDYEVLLGC